MNKQVLCLFCINLFSAMGYSLIAPLYPTLGKERQINDNILGWIISIFALFNFAITPFTPLLSNKYGRKHIFFCATTLEAVCTFVYGFLDKIGNYYLLICLSFLVRIVHGIGSGITATLVYSLTSSVAETSEVKISLGYLEIAWSLGLSIGPPIASLFYYIGGFSLPFYMLGLVLSIGIFMVYSLQLPMEETNEETNMDYIKLVKHADIINYLFIVVIYLIANTFYFPSLTNHLIVNWNLNVEMASLFFMINMVSYVIAIQFLDYITKKIGFINSIWSGLILIFVGAPFIYPLNFLPQNTISIIIGLVLIGASGASINVPVIMEVCRILKINDPTLNDIVANDISSAMYNFAVNIGDFCGPIFGGFISENYGFNNSCLLMSLVSFTFSVFFLFRYKKIMIHDLNYSSGGYVIGDNNDNRISNINIPIRQRRKTNNSTVDEKLCFLTKYQGNELLHE